MLAAEDASAGWFLEHAWLIPLIPAVAFFAHHPVRQAGMPTAGAAEIGIASMVASLVLAVGTDVPVDPRASREQRTRPSRSIKTVDVVAERRAQVRHRRAHRRPGGDDAAARRVHLHARADLLARVRARRSPLHPLLRRAHAVQRRHADDGARREHGPADPRLGDHGPLLVHADRPLVGGGGQQPRPR